MPRLSAGAASGDWNSSGGDQPNAQEAPISSISPTQNTGAESPNRLTPCTTWSIQRPSLTPATMPSGTPTNVASTSVTRPSSSVTANACSTMPVTGRPCVQLMPRLPASASPSQARYWR